MPCGQSHTNGLHFRVVRVTPLEKQARKETRKNREAIGQGNEEKQNNKTTQKANNLPLEKTVGSPGMERAQKFCLSGGRRHLQASPPGFPDCLEASLPCGFGF